MYSLTEQKEQKGNSYTALCQYFPGLPIAQHIQSLSVCQEHYLFFVLPLAFEELSVNFGVTASSKKSSK